MIDATILIPTYRHPALVPYSVASALAQTGVSIEVFVVGDGVEDETRVALEPFHSDPRFRSFDFPKGQHHGELNRHKALHRARGKIVCYLSDDDLLLPDHAAEMSRLLQADDFAHSAPLVVLPDGSLSYWPIDVACRHFQALLLRGDWNAISLTGAAHTLDAYRRLPYGWRPAPADVWSDLYMWQHFLGLSDFRGRTGRRLTHLHLPEPDRRGVTVAERVAELELWSSRIQDDGFADELAKEVADVVSEAAVRREARIHQLEGAISGIQATRLWRLRTGLATSWPLRALLARRRV